MAFQLFHKLRQAQRPYCSAIVAAAGSSVRMDGVNKLLKELAGMPVLVHTLRALNQAVGVDEIIIAARGDEVVEFSRLCREYGIDKPTKVVCGGDSRVESVMKAALEANPEAKLLAVQDGARPLVTPELIDRVIEKASRCMAAAPGIKVKDTVKTVHDGEVTRTLDRETLMAVQTPQVFEASLLKAALQSALQTGVQITDDCSAVERLGKVVYLVDGAEDNLKITTPTDLIVAEALLRERMERT